MGKMAFFVQIMLKFKRVYNLRVVSIVVAVVFFLNTAAYGTGLSNQSRLRIPLIGNNQKEGGRPSQALENIRASQKAAAVKEQLTLQVKQIFDEFNGEIKIFVEHFEEYREEFKDVPRPHFEITHDELSENRIYKIEEVKGKQIIIFDLRKFDDDIERFVQIYWDVVGVFYLQFMQKVYEVCLKHPDFDDQDYIEDYMANFDESYISKLNIKRHHRVLDIGTGLGCMALIARRYADHVVGIDICKTAVSKSKKNSKTRGIDNVNFVQTDGAHLPFAEHSFDVVLSQYTFSQLPPELKRRVLRESFGVLKPGGALYLFVYSKEVSPLAWWNDKEWKKELKSAGFEVGDIEYFKENSYVEAMLIEAYKPPTINQKLSGPKAIPVLSELKMRASREFGQTGLRFFPIGLGTIWFGREWPIGEVSYKDPSFEEIESYFDKAFEIMANEEGIIMVDTAAAYGYSEERIGACFRKRYNLLQKTFIATKWGEEFDVSTGESRHDYSKENLIFSVNRSLAHLGKIDLLYIHGTGPRDMVLRVLQDSEVIEEAKSMKESHNIKYLGVSISRADILEPAIGEELLEDFDVVQIAVDIYLQRPELVDKLSRQGKAIVINSPIRKGQKILADKNHREIYELLLKDERVVTLTGTRYHLEETVGYVRSDLMLLKKVKKPETDL